MNYSFKIPTSATATEVAPALLAAVFQAAGGDTFAVNKNVHWNTVLHHFITLTGLSMDAFGVDNRGYPRLKTAISGAWGHAKKAGLAKPSPRRTYCLSAMGVQMAMGSGHPDTPTPTPEPTPTPAPEPAAPVAKVVVVEPKGEVGVSWAGPSGSPNATHTAYETDAYFRSLAAEKTRCFGKWSPRATACKECPLAALCAKEQVSLMASFASTLDAEFEAAVNTPVVEEAPPVVEEEAVVEPTLPEGAAVIPVAFETVCGHCGKICPEGSEAVHITGKGMFHIECVPHI